MLKTALAAAAIIYFAAFGLVSTIRPEKVRDYYYKQFRAGLGRVTKLSGFERYYPRAPWFRLFGIFSLASALLLVYALLKS